MKNEGSIGGKRFEECQLSNCRDRRNRIKGGRKDALANSLIL